MSTRPRHPNVATAARSLAVSWLLVPLATAAPISWGTATNTTGKSQLIEGEVVLALSGGTGATVTGGGASGTSTYAFTGVSYQNLTFAPAPGNRITADVSNGAPSTGDADFDTVIKSFTDTNANIASGTQTIGGLSAGTEYRIQVFFNDQRSTTSGRVMTYGDGASPAHNVSLAAAGNGWGQHAIGIFTASGSTQSLTHIANGFANVHFNAILVTKPGPPPAPAAPTNLAATAGDASVTLDWDDNTQFGFARFIVRRSTTAGGPYSDIPGATPTASAFTDAGLVNGVTYHYVVAAQNTLGQISPNSAPASATPQVFVPPPPAVPARLTVTPGNNRNTLNWDDNTQPGFREFRVKRSTVAGGSPPGVYQLIATTSQSGYLDTTAPNGTTYYYVVTAVNSADAESAPSDERPGTPSAAAAPPNFLFIITDDQDTYSIGAYRRSEPAETGPGGQPYVVDTPNMDRLAAEGMLFHQARLMGADSGAVCQPSRTCIMTGKNTWQRTQGITAAVTFPGIFNRGARAGLPALPHATYRTCKAGNTYALANAEFTVVNDVDKRGNTDGSGSEWHADWGISYLEHWRLNHRPAGKPFFIYLGFSHPHDTRLARTTPDLTGRYHCTNTSDPAAIVPDPLAPPLPLNHLPCTPANYPAHPFDHGHLGVRDENSVDGIGQYRTEAVVRNEIGRNYACVDWIDRQLGRVFAKLEDPDGDGDQSDSVLDNTYLVFTTDHGIAIGRHGLQGKQNLYEHTWRIPYLVRGPGIAPGSQSDALIYLHDSFPTFCDLAGLDLPATIDGNDGKSFRDVLEGRKSAAREIVYGLYAGGSRPGIRAVTDGRFKLIKYDVANHATQVTQLFDLEENPFELLPEHGVPNLASRTAYSGIRQRLEESLMRQRKENADPAAFLGDRLLWRFEDGAAGQPAATLADRFPFARAATAFSGNGSALPAFASDVPADKDFLLGESNKCSLRLGRAHLQHLQVADARELDFGATPFTIEAWVKLAALPTGPDAASTMPVVMKRALAAGDSNIDYLFLATAGTYGGAAGFARLALILGPTTVVSSLAIPDTGWHHISAALDPVADVVRFTLDGQTDQRSSAASGVVNTGPLVIGAHFDAAGKVDSSFDGLLDELSITNGFLPRAELQPLAGVPTPGPFQVERVALEPAGTLALTFGSNENFLYEVQSSTDLAADHWSTVRSFVAGAQGASSTTLRGLPMPPGGRGFYRLVARPPGPSPW